MEGNEQKTKKPIYKKWWFWLIVIVIVVGIASSTGETQNNETKPTSTSTNVEEKKEELLEVDYKVLHQDYMDNPISADAKYKDKMLKLTGVVDNIDREIAGNTYITFHIGDQYSFQDVRITFKKSEESKVAQLKKGQNITIKGRCQGTILSTTVSLMDSEIVE